MTTRHLTQPLVSVALAVRKNGKVLLHKRKGMHSAGDWAFPGGHLDKWEQLGDCALREMSEECGPELKVANLELWTVVNSFFRSENKHYVCVVFIADWLSGEPVVMEPDKCECWQWFAWDELPSPLMRGIKQLYDDGFDPFKYEKSPSSRLRSNR